MNLLFPLLLLLADGQPSRTPQLIRHADAKYTTPLWVSVQQAFGPRGEVNEHLFDTYGLVQIRTHLVNGSSGRAVPGGTTDADPCKGFESQTMRDREKPKPNASLADLGRYSLAIYRGTIEDISIGLLSGDPGSLLRVHVERSIKAAADAPPVEAILVYYPYARAAIGPYVLCKADPRFPYRPSVGDDIMVFAYHEPYDETHSILVPEPTEVALQPRDGKLRVGARLNDVRGETLQTLSDLEDAVVALIGRKDGRTGHFSLRAPAETRTFPPFALPDSFHGRQSSLKNPLFRARLLHRTGPTGHA